VDHRRHVHHTYLPHLPAFWDVVFLAWAAALGLGRPGGTPWLALGVTALNVFSTWTFFSGARPPS
jgi:hypothetical protein